jgi:hypothetical protein
MVAASTTYGGGSNRASLRISPHERRERRCANAFGVGATRRGVVISEDPIGGLPLSLPS